MAKGLVHISNIHRSGSVSKPSAVSRPKPVLVRERPSGMMKERKVSRTLKRNTHGLRLSAASSEVTTGNIHLLKAFRKKWSSKELSNIDLVVALKLNLINPVQLDHYKNKSNKNVQQELRQLKKALSRKTYEKLLTKKQKKLFKRGRRLFKTKELSNKRLMQAIRYHVLNNSFFSKNMNFKEPFRSIRIREIIKEVEKYERSEVKKYLLLGQKRTPDTLIIKRSIRIIKNCFVQSLIRKRSAVKNQRKSAQRQMKGTSKRQKKK